MARVDIDWHGERAETAADRGAQAGLDAALEHLLGQARALVPIETGHLEQTGTAAREGLHGAVSFGGPYARRQHEELTWRHDPGRQAKYLEVPLYDGADERDGIIAAHIRRELDL